MHELIIRNAAGADVDHLAQLWSAGWQDAHAELLPEDLKRLRTLGSFRERLIALLASVRLAEKAGAIAGFSILKDDELYQFYVAASARGTNLASTLMEDALAHLRAGGFTTAWLSCAIGNERAARFYQKLGWRRVGVVTSQLPTPEGPFLLDVWRYEFDLRVRDQ